MLKLYFFPGSCSLASHAALEEAGLPYRTELVDLRTNMQQSDAYRAKNPFGRVPALELEDGSILTENVAILSYIASRVPERKLLPMDGMAQMRALEFMAILSNTVHIAFRPIFRSNRFARSEEAQAEVIELALENLGKTFALLEARLGEGPYVLGDRFSLCDLYLFVFVRWLKRPDLDATLDHCPRLAAFAKRIEARPSVRVAMDMEASAMSALT